MRIQFKNEAPECPCGPLARNTPGEPHRLWWCILLRWGNHRFSGFCSCLSWWVLSPRPVSSPLACYVCSIEQMCILNRIGSWDQLHHLTELLFFFTQLLCAREATEFQGQYTSSTWIRSNSNRRTQARVNVSLLVEPQLAGAAVLDALEDLGAHSAFEGFLFLSLLEVIVGSGATKFGNACCPVFLEPFDFPLEFKFQCLAFNELVRPHRPHYPCKSPHFFS